MTAPLGKTADLYFHADGKFRIMQVADTQDTQVTSKDTLAFLAAALDEAKPDLVVFTGDQFKGYGVSFLLGDREANYKKAIDNLIAPLEQRGIPFTFVFGNHDDQAFGIPKEKQLAMYRAHKNCLAVAGDESLAGLCNQYLNIRSHDGEKILFNLYLIDSLSTTLDGKCASVTAEQIEWYRTVRESLKKTAGDYVPSILFQHIPVPEMWDLLKEVPKSHKPHAQGFREHYGKFYDIDEQFLQKGNCDFLLETPATPAENSGEFAAVAEKGDTLAMFFGHDHNNSFVGKHGNMLLGYTQGCGFNVYGPRLNRGVRLIDLDEQNPNAFSTYTLLYRDLFSAKDIQNKPKYLLYSYAPPSVESVLPTLKKLGIAAGAAAVAGIAYTVCKQIRK